MQFRFVTIQSFLFAFPICSVIYLHSFFGRAMWCGRLKCHYSEISEAIYEIFNGKYNAGAFDSISGEPACYQFRRPNDRQTGGWWTKQCNSRAGQDMSHRDRVRFSDHPAAEISKTRMISQ